MRVTLWLEATHGQRPHAIGIYFAETLLEVHLHDGTQEPRE